MLGVYNNETNTTKEDAWLGKPYQAILAFCGDQTNDTLAAHEADWAVDVWGSANYKGQLILSIQLMADQDAGKLIAASTGSMDAIWAGIAKEIVAKKLTNAILRPGWEFNGGWYSWAAGTNPAAFAAAFKRFVTVFRANGCTNKICWCTGLGTGQANPELCYPGDDVVDIIGADVYLTASNQLQWLIDEPDGLNWLAGFGRQHNKPLAFPEWGTTVDDPAFIQYMHDWIGAHPFAFHCYWESNSGAKCSLMDGTKPLSAALFKKLFGVVAPSLTAKVNDGGLVTVDAEQADGSFLVHLSFPTTTAKVNYIVTVSEPCEFNFVGGIVWNGGKPATAFSWGTNGTGSGATGKVRCVPSK